MNCNLPGNLSQPSTGLIGYRLDPIQDPRWGSFVRVHPRASVFHTVEWLRTLRRTYGYTAVAFTTTQPGTDLTNGLVFCQVESWLTGRRLVSLPFSDHSEPLCDSTDELRLLIQFMRAVREEQSWKYLQIRPLKARFGQVGAECGFVPCEEYYLHALDLRPCLDDLFCSFDRDSVQRRIQRAERAGLIEKCGRSHDLLKDFYSLFVLTRRRQRVPPTPYLWFCNLVDEMDQALEMRVAYKDAHPVAAMLTLQFKDTTYYKYGCSDARFNNYAATPWLFWKAITSAKSKGATRFDFGRTEPDNSGLLAFKNQWVPNPRSLVYWRYPGGSVRRPVTHPKWNVAKSAFALLPAELQIMVGKVLYPHVG